MSTILMQPTGNVVPVEMAGRVCDGGFCPSGSPFSAVKYNQQVASASAIWKKLNPRRHAAHSKAWRERNKEQRREYEKRRYQQPHRKLANLLRVRARQTKMKSTPAIDRIYARCAELRRWFNVVVDHIIPLAKGGTHTLNNLQIIYARENLIKGTRLDYKPRVIFS